MDCKREVTPETTIEIPNPDMGNVVYCPGCFRVYNTVGMSPSWMKLEGNAAVYYDKDMDQKYEHWKFVMTERGKFEPTMKLN